MRPPQGAFFMPASDSFTDYFEQRVEEGLSACAVDFRSLLALKREPALAVSGGADSIALLTACLRLRQKYGLDAAFQVITVDHNIRPAEESGGDAAFVDRYCASYAHVGCTVVRLAPGEAEALAAERKRGLEEAARFLRYAAFDHFANAHSAPVLLLAHTRDDALETILMRFLQGGAALSLSGIPRKRGLYARPLLDLSRAEIERYLGELRISFRTDKTNKSERYLRNRLRLSLIPVLNRILPGWDKAVLSAAEKAGEDGAYIDEAANAYEWERRSEGELAFPSELFFSLPEAVRRRILYRGLCFFGGERFPYTLVKRALHGRLPLSARGLVFSIHEGCIKIRRMTRKKQGFFAIITVPGTYRLGGLSIRVDTMDEIPSGTGDQALCNGLGKKEQPLCEGDYALPLCLRSPRPGDEAGPCGLVAEGAGSEAAMRCRIRIETDGEDYENNHS